MNENIPLIGVTDFLKEEVGLQTLTKVAEVLKMAQPQLTSWRNSTTIEPRKASSWQKIASRLYHKGYEDGKRAGATETILSALRHIQETYHLNENEVALAAGTTAESILRWRNSIDHPSTRQMFNVISAYAAHAVSPIEEFREIHPKKSGGNEWAITSLEQSNTDIRKKLSNRPGLYMFYDSSGSLLYVGKASGDLYKEIRQRLKGTGKRPFYRPKREASPQYGNMTRYLSAYYVPDRHVLHNLEVLLLRTAPNDLSNKNSGAFKSKIAQDF